MTDILCQIRIGPPRRAGTRPDIRAGEAVAVFADFLDESGVLFPGVQGAYIQAVAPDGTATTWSGADLSSPALGTVRRQVLFNAPGTWVLRAGAGAPTVTVAETVVPIGGSAAAAPGPVTQSVEQAIGAATATVYASVRGIAAEEAAAAVELARGGMLLVDGGRGVQPGQRPTVDDGAAIIEAAQEVYSRWGGGRVVLWRSHRVDGPVPLPPGVDIGYVTPPGGPRVLRPSGEPRLLDVPALYVGPNGYVAPQHSVRGMTLVRDGLPSPVTYPATFPWSTDAMEAALDRQMAFDGVPLRILGTTPGTVRDDINISGISGYGFGTLIRAETGARLSLSNIRGDNNNLVFMQNSGGEPRVSDINSRSYLGSGGTTAISCPILAATNAGGLLSITIAPPREPPSTKEWQPNAYYLSGTKIYWAGNLYRVLTSGTTGTIPPTHTAGRATNGDTTLTWQRAWNGVNLAPASSIPKTTGGFLKPGHSVILQVPPYDCYTGNPSYPHWSTPGAPADVVTWGGDLLDPMMRGRYTVQALGAADADTATIILDCPYDPGLAAATANRYLLIMPGVRFGTMIRTDDVDACQMKGLQSKAQRFHLWANGATHTILGDQYEESSTGESDVEDWGSIGYLIDKAATRFEVIGTASKTKGILYYVNGSGRNVIRLRGLARGAGLYAVFHHGGAVDADLLFEGTSIVYSRSSALHMALRWSGTKPTVAGDTDPTERVSLDGYVTAPTNRKRARSIVGGNGIRLGVGSATTRYAPGATYAPNAIIYNDLADDDGQWLYRNSATAAGAAGTGNGPQHTSGTVVDGACSWTAIGAYSGGVDTIEIGTAGEVSIWDRATGSLAPRQRVARFPRTAPELYGEIWQVTPDAAETKTPVVSRRGDLRVRSRTTAEATSTDADAAASGRSRLVRVTDAPGAPTLALAFEDQEPVPLARLDGTGAVALPGVTGALARPWIARLLENITVRDTGALGNDVADDTAAFLNCIEWCRTRNLPVRVPTAEVAYRITDTLPFYSRMKMVGAFGGNSLLRWRGGGDKHILARHNWADDTAGEVDYCGIRDIRIDDWTATLRRTGKWALNFSNGDTHYFVRMEYEGRTFRTSTGPADDPREDLYGLLVGRHPNGLAYSGRVWETKMLDCSFRRGQVWWNLTDGKIEGGILYALACAYSLRLGGGNIVEGVTFIPGEIYGAIHFTNPDPTQEIFNPAIGLCHFDGNNEAYTRHAFYASGEVPLINPVITGNKAWNISREAVRLLDCHGATIGHNAFRQNSAHGHDPADPTQTPVAYPDVYIDGNDNHVATNSYRRMPTFPKPGSGGTRTVLAPPVVFAAGRTGNRLDRGVVTPDSHGYSTTSFRHQAKVGENLLDGFREDWNGAAISTAWVVALGTPGGGARAPAATLINGELNLVLGDSSPSTQDANGVQIDRALALRPDRATPHQSLEIEAEIRVTNATGLAFFFGLANRVGAPVELPFTLSGTTLSSPQANAVGFLFDTAADADVIHCVGTKAGVDATPIATAIAPAGGTNYVLRIEIEVGGRASFFIDGALVGVMANAVTATAWLTAHLSAFSRSTVQKSLICRRLEAWQPNP